MKSTIVRSLEEGTALFNRWQFFEAHEVWEDGWRIVDGRDRLLLHGLIQIAAGFHKLQCGQPGGCATLLSKGAGIVLISSYLPEVYELADTLHVFRRGKLVATHGFRTADHEDILSQALAEKQEKQGGQT